MRMFLPVLIINTSVPNSIPQVAPTPPNNIIENLQKNSIGDHFHWNEKCNSEVIKVTSTPYGILTSDPKTFKKIYTFNLGYLTEKPRFNKLDFNYSFNNIVVKWGNQIMKQKKWDSINIEFHRFNNVKAPNIDYPFFIFATSIPIYQENYQHGWVAYCEAIFKLGFTWYQENNQYYFQILIYNYLNTVNSYSSATSIIDLGEILRLGYF